MKKQIYFAALAALMMLATSATAQKIGYLNAAAILADMQEVKAADSELSAMALQLQKQDSTRVVDWQRRAQDLQQKNQAGTIAPKQAEELAKALEEDKQKITQFEQQMNQTLTEKRKTLYQPILERVNNAIKDVSKEGGFAYVLDATSGILLYADEKMDIGALVRTKLGLPAVSTQK
jgi:outer membrane protein